MIQEVIVCDRCGKQRNESNHWFAVRCPTGRSYHLEIFLLQDAQDEADYRSLLHLCGCECLMRCVSQWAATGGEKVLDGGDREPSATEQEEFVRRARSTHPPELR